MSELVKVPYEGKASDKAVLLLAAAQELGVDSRVVQAQSGHFLVPAEVADQAFAPPKEEKPAVKKTAAKKSTPKKSQE